VLHRSALRCSERLCTLGPRPLPLLELGAAAASCNLLAKLHAPQPATPRCLITTAQHLLIVRLGGPGTCGQTFFDCWCGPRMRIQQYKPAYSFSNKRAQRESNLTGWIKNVINRSGPATSIHPSLSSTTSVHATGTLRVHCMFIPQHHQPNFTPPATVPVQRNSTAGIPAIDTQCVALGGPQVSLAGSRPGCSHAGF